MCVGGGRGGVHCEQQIVGAHVVEVARVPGALLFHGSHSLSVKTVQPCRQLCSGGCGGERTRTRTRRQQEGGRGRGEAMTGKEKQKRGKTRRRDPSFALHLPQCPRRLHPKHFCALPHLSAKSPTKETKASLLFTRLLGARLFFAAVSHL